MPKNKEKTTKKMIRIDEDKKEKFYLQELKGTFDKANLFKIDKNRKKEYLAHSWRVPNCILTTLIMPEHKDFKTYWLQGEAKTSTGYSYGGHHLGQIKKISKKEAESIILKIKKSKKTRNNLKINI